MLVEEGKKEEILEKIEKIKRSLPRIEKLIKEGKFVEIFGKNAIVIDVTQEIFQVHIKESRVTFLICEFD